MQLFSPSLYIIINNFSFIFLVGDKDEKNNFKIIYEENIKIDGIFYNKILDYEKTYKVIKDNIYYLEQKLNYTFKETIIILENFNLSFINISGFKNLNSSQILKENIYYILNTLKSYVEITEIKKTILHIFNSKFILDKKEIKNLPIGLFGDSYSHELSFILANKNDLRNLKSIFEKCNLKIKKILVKSFIEGAYLANKIKNFDTFFLAEIKDDNTKIFYFENNSLKFEQNFNFGTEIILQDIKKITLLDRSTIINVLREFLFDKELINDELVEKEYFKKEKYRKIKKKLIFDIVNARIKEISEIIFSKNVNFDFDLKKKNFVFLRINIKDKSEFLEKSFLSSLRIDGSCTIKISQNISSEDLVEKTDEIVHYGWEKEAIPIIHEKKTVIARFFDMIFG